MVTHRTRARIARMAVAAGIVVPALTVVALPVAAHATAVQNGRIYFSTGVLLPDPDLSVPSQVWSVRPDGTNKRQLTHVPAPALAGGPDVSPNGTRVLYVSNVAGPFQVWVMRADGSGQHRVVTDLEHDAFVPRWSPDGTHLLFTRCSFPFDFLECTIATARLDGSGLHDITGGHWVDFSGAYSSDGSKIAFSGDRNGLTSAIYRKSVASGSAHRLTAATLEAFWPDYRPDGQQILFGDNADRPTTNVWTMRPDGTQLHQITHIASDQNLAFARYAPDGRHLVADFFDGSTDWLVTMNLDGSHFTKVLNSGDISLTLADWAVAS